MAITYNIRIFNMEAKSNYDNKQNVIYNIHWGVQGEEVIEATDDTPEKRYIAELVGVTHFELENADLSNFVEYENLAKADVVAWIEADEKNDIPAMKQSIADNIENQKNPVDISLRPNW